jgi:hypothetical protein
MLTTTKIDSTQGWTDSPMISADGKRLLFMWSRYNYFPIFSGGEPVLGDEVRVGHHLGANAWLDSDVYQSSLSKGDWSAPVDMPYNSARGESCIHESVLRDGRRKHYYNVQGPDANGALIACRTQLSNGLTARSSVGGEWSLEEILPATINARGVVNQNAWVNSADTVMYFHSMRSGNGELWRSTRADPSQPWGSPVVLGPEINSGASEDQPFLLESSGEFFFNRDSQIWRSVLGPSGFSAPVPLNLGVTYVAEPSMPADGLTLYAVVSYPGEQRLRVQRWARSSIGSTVFTALGPLD